MFEGKRRIFFNVLLRYTNISLRSNPVTIGQSLDDNFVIFTGKYGRSSNFVSALVFYVFHLYFEKWFVFLKSKN